MVLISVSRSNVDRCGVRGNFHPYRTLATKSSSHFPTLVDDSLNTYSIDLTPYLRGIAELLQRDVIKIIRAFKPLLVEEGFGDEEEMDKLIEVSILFKKHFLL